MELRMIRSRVAITLPDGSRDELIVDVFKDSIEFYRTEGEHLFSIEGRDNFEDLLQLILVNAHLTQPGKIHSIIEIIERIEQRNEVN